MEQEGVEQQIFLQPEMAVIGGGAVSSVNGYTGDVVLTTSDLENTSDYQTGSEVAAAIGTEATAREAADNNLQTQIDAISASSDVTDIVGTYAELQNYDTSTLGDNDIIKVLQDESQNGETTYYRWSTTTQSFTLIGEEGPYYTKAQADVLLNAKQDTLTAGANIQISNNTISATDTTYSDFTGTDGTAAGAAGLVPAPATTDAGKFLKADGTWDDAGASGGVTELTADDYNYPTNNPNGVALWRLSPGLYNWDNGVRVYTSASSSTTNGASVFVTEAAGNAREYVEVVRICPGGVNNTYNWSKVNYNTGAVVSNIDNAHLLSSENVVQTTGTSTTDVMSQDATTKMVFENANDHRIKIGDGASTNSAGAVAIGRGATATGFSSMAIGAAGTYATGQCTIALGQAAANKQGGVAIGIDAQAQGNGSIAIGGYRGSNDAAFIQINKHGGIALGMGSQVTETGEMNIGDRTSTYGYNNSAYRLLSGLYDPQNAHDAATKGYVDGLVGNVEAALNAINNGGN